MEPTEIITEDILCDSLNGCINLSQSSCDPVTTKTRPKRPDREFYVPPNAHSSKVKSPTTDVTSNKPSKKSPQMVSSKPNHKISNNQVQRSHQSKVKKVEVEIPPESEDQLPIEKINILPVVNEERKIGEQKENPTKLEIESSGGPSPPVDGSTDSDPSWDDLYDDAGVCVKPQLKEQYSDPNEEKRESRIKMNGNQYKAIDSYDTKLDELVQNGDNSKFAHVLEIYDFPSDLRTQDLVTSLSVFNSRDFDIKWVDDTHALAVFASQTAAREAMSMPYNNIRLRPLNEAIKESRVKAQKCTEYLLPYRQRPQTSAVLARRLVTGALGLRSNISPEQRAAEKKRLQEAKEKRRLALKLTQDAWEGNVG